MKALVCGSSGFIGHYLVRKLKSEGYFVRGASREIPKYDKPHEFVKLDLRDYKNCLKATKGMDEVYQLSADMGGMGFILDHETDCMYNSALINLNMIKASCENKVKKYFFSSSVCIYPNTLEVMNEESAYPANPDNEYGWEKIFSERVIQAFGREYPIEIRIGRFENVYGPETTWQGERAKAPAALCRKIAVAKTEYEVWGDGSPVRKFTYVTDTVEAIRTLMKSSCNTPVIISTDESITIGGLCDLIEKASGKKLKRNYIKGNVGHQIRRFDTTKIKSLGWNSKVSMKEGITNLYNWINELLLG